MIKTNEGGNTAGWLGLPVYEQAKEWEKLSPGTFQRLLDRLEAADNDKRRQARAEFFLRLFGMVCALAVTGLFIWLAMVYLDRGAPTQGAGIFGAGATTIVIGFLTGGRQKPSKKSSDVA
jgi:hypothetical protein